MPLADVAAARIAICWRRLPTRIDEERSVLRLLKRYARHVVQAGDARLPPDEFDVVLLLENSHWFPTVVSQFASLRASCTRPLLAVWHWEPLPLPSAAGVLTPSLSLREKAKIVLRDRRATDIYTNLAELRRLRRDGWPDLLMVSSRAWQESLAQHGIHAHWVPYGYATGHGAPIGGERNIEALFIGAVDVPRRKRIIRDLWRRGVQLVAHGDWFDERFWGDNRTRLINRAQSFLNIQRYPQEISAHRLILGMANKSLVVSEPIYRPAPFVAGEHYVEAEAGDIPEVLRYYREHPAEREEIVDRAHRLVSETLTMERSVSRVMALIDEQLRARNAT
jgi:hypothetical protein